jgi:hypothetical protein
MKFISRWLPNSPDLNPIEHLWGLLKHQLGVLCPKNLNEVRSHLLNLWENIPIELINHLVLSFQHRLSLCVHYGGHSIGQFLRKNDFEQVDFTLSQTPGNFHIIQWFENQDNTLDNDESIFLDPKCGWLREEDQIILDRVTNWRFK